MAGPHVICAAGDRDRREWLSSVLGDALDVEVVGAGDPAEALAALDDVSTRALVSVPQFPDADRSGMELLAAARERAPDVACILFGDVATADVPDDDTGTVVAAVDEDAPDAENQLVTLVERAIQGRSHAAYPVPDDESERIETLREYPTDDERLRAAFDRLAAMTAAALDADYAYVSLVGEREQEHLATHGFEPMTVDRERSICAYTVAAGEVTVIEALDSDPRFEGEDYVSNLDLRWYAGAPVRVSGSVVGTVCVLGSEAFEGVDQDLLGKFADEAADQFEFARLRQA